MSEPFDQIDAVLDECSRMVAELPSLAVFNEVVAALEEMLVSHSMENIGVNASMRRIKAKQAARAVLAKALGK